MDSTLVGPIYFKINRQQTYRGRVFVLDEWEVRLYAIILSRHKI